MVCETKNVKSHINSHQQNSLQDFTFHIPCEATEESCLMRNDWLHWSFSPQLGPEDLRTWGLSFSLTQLFYTPLDLSLCHTSVSQFWPQDLFGCKLQWQMNPRSTFTLDPPQIRRQARCGLRNLEEATKTTKRNPDPKALGVEVTSFGVQIW